MWTALVTRPSGLNRFMKAISAALPNSLTKALMTLGTETPSVRGRTTRCRVP